jgi:putative selenate reductase
VAMNFVPVTTCTDLLRPGGYARLARYLENLAGEMRRLGVRRITDFVLHLRGQAEPAGGDPVKAGLLNTPILVAEATANPRYTWSHNRGVPRKIGSNLWMYDCIDCDKCVPVCPNDANFAYETAPMAIVYDHFVLAPGSKRAIPGGVLRVVKSRQFANYADACNDCGNCDVFCPEDGSPNFAKPRFLSSLESYRKSNGADGFFLDWTAGPTLYATIAGRTYTLAFDQGRARFTQPGAEVILSLADNEPLSWQVESETLLDMLVYLKLKLLAESISDPRRVHFANAGGIQERLA